MKDTEIIKAYEEEISKPQNHYIGTIGILWNALDLINRQRTEIERLNIELKTMRGAANSWKAEVQRICKREFDNIEIDIEAVKSEAVREFAKELMYNLDGDIEAYANAGHGLNVYKWLKSYLVSKGAIEMGCNDG